MIDRPPPDAETALRGLIEAPGNTEHECRRFLQYVASWLFRSLFVEYVYVETEYRGHAGDSDYVISGQVRDETGVEIVQAYVWELKAPQCHVFERETESRLRPSDDLVRAENQLFNYHDELKGNARFLERFGVTHPESVHLGGIIIGSSRTRVRGDLPEERKLRLFQTAKRIRDIYVYHGVVRLATWDTIVDQLRPPNRAS